MAALATLAALAAPWFATLAAQPLPDSIAFRGMKWRSIGPNRGGRSLAVGGSATRPDEYWFGAVGGGAWKTTDGGQTWTPMTDGKLRSSSVGALAVAPSNPDVVYIGMGETALRGNIMQGDGVYRTTDGGKTWTHLGLAETQAIGRIRVHPTKPDVAWVAAFGHPSAPNAERGVFKTTDGGKTWRKVLFRDAKSGAVDLSVDPTNPDVLYASLWEAYRITWQMSSGGPGSGLFKSTDGGETWTEITRNPGMPAGMIGKIGVTAGANGRRVWAIVENESGGVFRSDDAGATWRRVNDERKLRQRAFYYSHIHADPVDSNRVYVLNVGMFRSDDGGVRFDTTIVTPHGDHHDLWVSPADNRRFVQGNDGGGTVTMNGGRSFTALDMPTAQLYHVSTTSDVPYHVCGAQQDNTTMCLPSRGWGNLRGARSERLGDWMYDAGGGESGYITQDPRNPDIFYAGSQGALLTRYDRRTGQIRDVQPYPRFFSGEPASALRERWQWTFPIVFNPKDPRTLYITSQHVWKTTDEGQRWTRISPDLTRADPATLGPTGGPITKDMNGPEIYATIFALAPSPLDGNVLWAGSDDGLVHVTRDGGTSWQKVTPPGMPDFARVSIIEASRHDPATAYVAAKHYLRDDRAPYIWRTTDFGRTWTKIVGGIRADDYVHVVREDRVRRGLLYAGTEHGVWVSVDDGASWRSLSLDLPDTQVSDLVAEQHDLVIGTHGRSAYVLDDIAPLREWKPDLVSATRPLALHAPRPAIRGIDDAAPIQYTLASAADSVRIEVLDSTGTVLRTFTGGGSGATPPATPAARPMAEAGTPATGAGTEATAARDTIVSPQGCETPRRRGGGSGARPTGRQGLNVFAWDMRLAGSTTFDCLILWSANATAGPLVVPGRYAVRVTAGGATETRPLEVLLNPNLKGVTVADLAEQQRLLLRVRDRVSAANEAVVRIRTLRSGIAQRLAQPNTPASLRTRGEALAQALLVVEDSLYQFRNRAGQDPLNFPIRLNNRIASLGRSIATGDARPTAGAYTVFDELSAELDAVLKRSRRPPDSRSRRPAREHVPDRCRCRALGRRPGAVTGIHAREPGVVRGGTAKRKGREGNRKISIRHDRAGQVHQRGTAKREGREGNRKIGIRHDRVGQVHQR
ncbi:MAG: hypothetical protein MUF21_03775, partial [Gemmatimonadaceae bacterium]|nr:hypothetical protein [Gemmatimonadaceae bacterium]